VGHIAADETPRDHGPGVFFSGPTALRLVAACSGLYDVGIGVALGFFRASLSTFFSMPAPAPPIHADLNALFAFAVGLGYLLPLGDPNRYRAYLWIMGPLLKGAGAVLFVWDVAMRGSPASFLLFAAGDGALAALTFWALLKTRTRPEPVAAGPGR
jgi:hypothetical protein